MPIRARNGASVIDILAGAAGPLAVGRCPVVVELQGDADDVVALGLEQGGRDRQIDPPGHGNHDPGFLRPALDIE